MLTGKESETYEPQREEANLWICAPNWDSNQPAHSRILIRAFVVRMKKLWILGYPKYAQWRFWLYCASAQADLNLRSTKVRFLMLRIIQLGQRDKTYNKTCVTRKDSDQPVHPLIRARAIVYRSLNSLKAVEGICNQRRLWSDCADAQADLSLRWSHKSYCRFCRAPAHYNAISGRVHYTCVEKM